MVEKTSCNLDLDDVSLFDYIISKTELDGVDCNRILTPVNAIIMKNGNFVKLPFF